MFLYISSGTLWCLSVGEDAYCLCLVGEQVSCQGDSVPWVDKAGYCPWHNHKPLRTHEIQLYHSEFYVNSRIIFFNQKNPKHIYDIGIFIVFTVQLPSVYYVFQKLDLCVNAQRKMYEAVI